MTIKTSYNLYFLFLIGLIGVFNMIQLPTLHGSQDKRAVLLKETSMTADELLKEKRRETLVNNTVASFYFRQ